MKRFLLAITFLAFGVPLYAQTVVHPEWQAPAPQTGVVVTGYTVQLDAGPIVNAPATLDATCNCFRSTATTLPANDVAAHTYTIKAQVQTQSTGVTPPVVSTSSGAPLNVLFQLGVQQVTVGPPTAAVVKVGP